MLLSVLDDIREFDRAAIAMRDASVLEALLAHVPPDVREAAEGRLPPRPPGASSWAPKVDVVGFSSLGRAGFWVSARWAVEVLPGRDRKAPSPAHELFDAIVERHAADPEAAWLVAELYAALEADQRALGRRVLIGLKRRFGDRGRRIVRRKAATAALVDLLDEL